MYVCSMYLDVAMDEALAVDVFDSRDLKVPWHFLSCRPVAFAITNSPTIWSASKSTVLSEKRRLQKLKRSSKDGPNNSITITL